MTPNSSLIHLNHCFLITILATITFDCHDLQMNQMFGNLCISRQDTPEVIKQTDTVSSVRLKISAIRSHCWVPCNPHLFPASPPLSRIQVLATVTRMPTLVRRTGTICHHANQTVATTPICSSFLTTSGKVAKHFSQHLFIPSSSIPLK